MRSVRLLIQLIITLTLVSGVSFANALPEDGLSITPQDGHILFDDSIDTAKVSIDMMMFRLTDKEVVTHLLAARQRGVKVRLILDQQAMMGNSVKAIAQQLTAAGAEVYPSSARFTITHTKAAVFDNQWALLTSMNLTTSFPISRDYGIRTYDPNIVAEFKSVFEADIKNSINQTKDTPVLNAQKLVWSPVNSKDKIIAFIKSAQSSVNIEVENLGDHDVLETLKSKAQSGVNVVVVVPACVEGGGIRNLPLMGELAAAGVNARVSVPPYTAQNPYIHAKTIVVDQQQYYVGSENLSYNSLTQAREVGIMDTNPQISAVLLKVIAYDANLATPMSQLNPNFVCPGGKTAH